MKLEGNTGNHQSGTEGERLIGKGVKPEHLNDDALGQALDDIHAFGVTELFSEIAAKAAKRLGITPKHGHMDSTSFHVDGNYNSDDPPDKDDDAVIHVTHGYSRDHRPDLNQAVLQLIIEQQANLPILMEPLNGNSNDKTAFADTITKHVGQLTTAYGLSLMVSDSAGFTKKCLHAYEERGIRWVMSVPGTIKRAKELLERADPESMLPLGEGYCYQQVHERYAGVEQRWLVISSEAAKARASKSVGKTLLKHSEDEQKRFARLCRQSFNCEQDAVAALEAFSKSLKVLEVISHEVTTQAHYPNLSSEFIQTRAGSPGRSSPNFNEGFFG